MLDFWCSDGDTPLHHAANGGHAATVTLLLERAGERRAEVRHRWLMRATHQIYLENVGMTIRSWQMLCARDPSSLPRKCHVPHMVT